MHNCYFWPITVPDSATSDVKYLEVKEEITDTKLNMSQGVAAQCLDVIIWKEDKHAARERIKT